jgi:radical SAM family protein
MRVYLVNPSHVSFGTAVITPRWLYVLAGATPSSYGTPIVCDETLDPFDAGQLTPGDVVGIGIHTGNALRGYEVGRLARARGAFVVFGGIHATLYPTEPQTLGGAHAVVRGDGDIIWSAVLKDCCDGAPRALYEAGRIGADKFKTARWDLLPKNRYMWAAIQTVRGCAKHCSFCSVWRTDGQEPRQAAIDGVIREAVELRRLGFRFIALADDNFYPISLTDLAQAERRRDALRLSELQAIRADRFTLMERLAALPDDMTFFTQITMEAAEDPAFLQAMARARIRGALVGVESVTAEGLKDVYKNFNLSGESLVQRLQTFRSYGIHVLGSFIFGLPSDRPATFEATADLADRAGISFGQFVMLTPFPGTVDFERWERAVAGNAPTVGGIPITRHWLIPEEKRPKIYAPHPVMSPEEIRRRTQAVWDRFYTLPRVWRRSRVVRSLKSRIAFVLISKLYRQMYANTGIATDSARHARSVRLARWMARPCQRLFSGAPMPELEVPLSSDNYRRQMGVETAHEASKTPNVTNAMPQSHRAAASR